MDEEQEQREVTGLASPDLTWGDVFAGCVLSAGVVGWMWLSVHWPMGVGCVMLAGVWMMVLGRRVSGED